MTAEQRVAETILEKPLEVFIGGTAYQVAPPCTATLILASEEVAKLPKTYDKERPKIEEVLRIAKDCKSNGAILAILILGAEGLTEKIRIPKRKILGLTLQWKEQTIDKKKELADFILNKMTNTEIEAMTGLLLKRLEIEDFFSYTTSLIEINMIRPTKEVVNKTIASGQ